MSDLDRDSYALRDEDRLPWLEPVDDEDEDEGVSPLKLAALVLVGLVVLGMVIGSIYWWQNRRVEPKGAGELIAAPAGDYKVKPENPGGMQVEGKGETAFATSQGAGPQGSLDLNAVPEAPVARSHAAKPKPQPKAGKEANATVEEGGRLAAKAPAHAAPQATGGGQGNAVQLGAFASEGIANKAWDAMTKRFAYVNGLEKSVMKADVNGKTYYRLRAATASPAAARQLCAKLRIAGENCIVVQ